MIYLELFWSFFQIGLFSIGGGYAAMPLIRHQVAEVHRWLTMEQFADIVTIAEMTPGPIAINAATFVGIRVAGPLGAVVATAGCVVPSCLIVMLLGFLYYRFRGLGIVQGILSGLRPAVIAMIASAGISLLRMALFDAEEIPLAMGAVELFPAVLFGVAFALLRMKKVSPMRIIMGTGVIGMIFYFTF
ncbi:MAG: chromate transporter [Clostridia bacterium]|nr:chromate transporter [Clostridia bacterium]